MSSQKYQRQRLSEALTTTGDSHEKYNNLVKYIVNLSVSKYPFKKVDLVKNAMAGDSKALGQLWPKVLVDLADVRKPNTVKQNYLSFTFQSSTDLRPQNCGSRREQIDQTVHRHFQISGFL
jgi:hypothetical protein